jgi:hypothetical protein
VGKGERKVKSPVVFMGPAHRQTKTRQSSPANLAVLCSTILYNLRNVFVSFSLPFETLFSESFTYDEASW